MKKILSGVLSFLIAIIFLELLSRVAFTIAADTSPLKEPIEEVLVYSREMGWERKPNFNGNFRGVERMFDEEGWLAGDKQKLADTTHRKILFIGDSNTFGNDSPADKIFVALVDSLLPNAVTVNWGVPGYTSYQGKVLLAKMLQRFRPDAIVVSFNYNDRRYVVPPDLPDGRDAFEKMYILSEREKMIRVLERVYIFRVVRASLRKFGFIQEEIVSPMDIDSLPPRVSPERYRTNLSEMVRMAKERNIPLWLLSLGDSPIQTFFLRHAVDLLRRGEVDSAIEALKIQAQQGTAFTPLARKFLKRAYEMKGLSKETSKAGIILLPLRVTPGGHPVLLDTEYNEIMRQVARTEGVEVIDGAAVLMNKQSAYYDFCHFDTTGHRMVAELIASRFRAYFDKPKEAIGTAASP